MQLFIYLFIFLPLLCFLDQPSCRHNCGSNMGSCSCTSQCKYNGSCCHDYYCEYLVSSKPNTEEVLRTHYQDALFETFLCKSISLFLLRLFLLKDAIGREENTFCKYIQFLILNIYSIYFFQNFYFA